MGLLGYENEVDVMCMNDLFVSSIASQKIREKDVCYKLKLYFDRNNYLCFGRLPVHVYIYTLKEALSRSSNLLNFDQYFSLRNFAIAMLIRILHTREILFVEHYWTISL